MYSFVSSHKSIDTLQYTCSPESFTFFYVRMCFSTERQYDLSWKILHHNMKTVYHSMLVSAYQYEVGIYVVNDMPPSTGVDFELNIRLITWAEVRTINMCGVNLHVHMYPKLKDYENAKHKFPYTRNKPPTTQHSLPSTRKQNYLY